MVCKIILILTLSIFCFHSHQVSSQQQFIQLFNGCRKQLIQWVGFSESTQQLIQKCHLSISYEQILTLYRQWTDIGLDFSHKHFDLLRKYLKQNAHFKESLKCLIDVRNTENEYLSSEEKKFKYFGKFIKQHPSQGKSLFVQQPHMWQQKGKKLCNYFKAFFQYYYLYILRPSQTSSTTFLRALTVRSSIFDHEDISYCVQIQTHGTIAQNLEGLDINNIYVKIPEVINAIKFMKLKKHCQDQKGIDMIKKVKEKLTKVDMFKIMYHDYEPFVQIAAEKFGTSQVKLLARKIAHIIQNSQEYEKYYKEEL